MTEPLVQEAAVAVIEKTNPSSTPDISNPPTILKLEFRGSAREYFKIWIVNLCLALLTFGVFSAWAKVRKKRYYYSNTLLDGTPFQYLGQPLPILRGRLIAAALFAAYYFSKHFFHSFLPYILIPGLFAAPWMLVRSAAFNSRYSAFRNITFNFSGSYMDAAKAFFSWGVAPVFVATTLLQWNEKIKWAGFLFLLPLAFFPVWMRNLKALVVGSTTYGGNRARFSASGSQYWTDYFIGGLFIFLAGIVAVVTQILGSKTHGFFLQTSRYAGFGEIYTGYALCFCYLQANISNLAWNNTVIGRVRFRSSLRFKGLARLYFSNALAIVGSAGLLIPWAVIRTLKYRAEHLEVLSAGDLSEFQGRREAQVSAVGAETMDLFDMDIGL